MRKFLDSKVGKAWLRMLPGAILIWAIGVNAGAAKESTTSDKTLENAPIIRDFRRPPPGEEITPQQQKKLQAEAQKHPQTIGPQGPDATYVNGVSNPGVVMTLEAFRTYVKKIGSDKFAKEMPVFGKYLAQHPPETWKTTELRFKNGKARELIIVEQDDWKEMCKLSGLHLDIGGKSDTRSH